MKCIIPGQNVKVFGRAIHSLARIGEELYFEPLEHGLALRTVNSSRSAYACFVFAPSFFQHYDDGSGEVNSQDSEDVLKCKIAMKSCLTVFKSLSNIEKTVDRCKITLNMNEARLVFQLYCKHGIVKTHNLAFIECETLQAVFSKDLCPNALTAQAKLLSDAVINFQSNQEEVTLIVNPQRISLKNYVDDEPDPNKVVHTELTLDPDEFDNVQVGVDTKVTFCLKELRAILAFSEVTGIPVTMRFETAGRPIVFSIDSDPSFEGNFVLATLAENMSSSQISCSQQSTQHNTTRKRVGTSNHSFKRHNSASGDTRQLTEKQTPSEEDVSQIKERMNESYRSKKGKETRKHFPKKSAAAKFDSACQDLLNDDLDDIVNQGANQMELIHSNTNQKIDVEEGDVRWDTGPWEDVSENSPVIPLQCKDLPKTPAEVLSQSILEEPDDEEDGEIVPGTPPSKKFKSMFFGVSQATETQPSQPKGLVLAEETDEED